jgi:predicted Zn-dependent peptidase
MPLPKLHTLDNGLRVVLAPMPHATSVSVSVYVAAGARYEQPHEAGLSHFVEHLCFKGTESRPRPQDISIEIDAIGGTINAATDREYTVYYAKATRQHAERALNVLADIVQHSLFRGEEIERERGVILEELAAVEDSPDEQSGLLLDSLVWPDQALGRDIAGTPASVGAISQERLIGYYREQYAPSTTVVSIAGALDPDAMLELVSREFAGWSGGAAVGLIGADAARRGARHDVLEKPTEQVHLSLGFRGVHYQDPDRYAVDVLSVILGEGMSSRLFMRLREELGLCYDIHSFAAHFRDAGGFGVYAGVDPSKARQAVEEIADQLRLMRRPVESAELERAQSLLNSRLLLRMEDSRAVSAWYGAQTVLELPRQTPSEVLEQIEAISVEDVQRAALRVLQDDALHLAAVGPLDDAELFNDVHLAD